MEYWVSGRQGGKTEYAQRLMGAWMSGYRRALEDLLRDLDVMMTHGYEVEDVRLRVSDTLQQVKTTSTVLVKIMAEPDAG